MLVNFVWCVGQGGGEGDYSPPDRTSWAIAELFMVVNIRVESLRSYIPNQIRDLRMKVRDQSTNDPEGKEKMDQLSVGAHQKKKTAFPIDFSCKLMNAMGDKTFLDFYKGCAPHRTGATRPGTSQSFLHLSTMNKRLTVICCAQHSI